MDSDEDDGDAVFNWSSAKPHSPPAKKPRHAAAAPILAPSPIYSQEHNEDHYGATQVEPDDVDRAKKVAQELAQLTYVRLLNPCICLAWPLCSQVLSSQRVRVRPLLLQRRL